MVQLRELRESLQNVLGKKWRELNCARTYRQVQRTIFEDLYEQYKEQVEDPKQLLELRDEFINWIEKHGSAR
jgi:hypothetical protein